MPGYAANLVRSGARSLSTRGRSYASPASLATLRGTTGKQAIPETPGVNTKSGVVQAPVSRLSSAIETAQTKSSGIVSQVRAETPFTISAVIPERTFSRSALPFQPSPESQNPMQAQLPASRPAKPEPPRSDAGHIKPVSASDSRTASVLTSRQHQENFHDGNAAEESYIAIPPVPAMTSSGKPAIGNSSLQPDLKGPDSANKGFYHGRPIRVEHLDPAANPASLLQQERPASSEKKSASVAKNPASPAARVGEQTTGYLSLRGTPRISVPTGRDVPVPAAEKRPETMDQPSIFSPRSAPGSPPSTHESVFAAAKRNSAREGRQSEGPRLSIGLLEVQIIQEPSAAPEKRAQPRSPGHEQDDLERSYIRLIG